MRAYTQQQFRRMPSILASAWTQATVPTLQAPCYSMQHRIGVLSFAGVQFAAEQSYSSHTTPNESCWQCSGNLNAESLFFCPNCKAILPPAPAHKDLYRVMGLANPTFDVDIRHLEARYKRLQKDLHPDKFGNREAKEQEYSAEQSSLVNHAYVKLKSPLQRALYLLERKGMPIAEDGGTISDPVLLMEVMEQRELVEETTDVGLLQGMLEENKLLEQATTQKLAHAFKADDLKAAERIITDLRYVTRTGEAISKKLP